MTNPVQIANLALSWMGQNKINSFGDDQNEAIVMNANYELSRDKVLEDAAWTFATERQVLSPIAAAPAFGAGNKFLIPTTVLKVHRVYRPTGTSQSNSFQNADYVREGRHLIAREESLWVIFIMKVTDSDLFSAGFVHALAARMAADTAMTFTENEKLEIKMEARYDTKLADAKYSDGSQGTTEVVRSTRLTGVRRR